MKSVPQQLQPVRWGFAACSILLSVAAGLLLGGCAGSGTSAVPVQANTAVSSSPSVDPDGDRRARIRLELAANYFQAGQTNVALDEVRQALAVEPNNADAYGLLGLIYMQTQDWPHAETSFRKALSLNARDSNLMHNFGWMQCQRQQYGEAQQWLDKALEQPGYNDRGKTWMAKGLCFQRAGQLPEAQQALFKAYEMDAGNPVVAYNLGVVLQQLGEPQRAQFYVRRLNNGSLANAESLWLGIKLERALGDTVAMRQLANQLEKRFPDSREWLAYERGAFNE